ARATCAPPWPNTRCTTTRRCRTRASPSASPDGERGPSCIAATDLDSERIRRKPVLGGLINEYTHAARHPEEPQVTRRILFSSGTTSNVILTERASHLVVP